MGADDRHERPTAPVRGTAPTKPGVDTTPPVRRDDYVGTVLGGRYRVIEKIGEGGFGAVYLAEHVLIEKKVALKVLAGELSRHRELVKRFQQEAKAASMIGQENIIDITDFGETPSGTVYFVMEYLQGLVLAQLVKQGPLPIPRIVRIVAQVCRALAAAHGKGIFHRDLKPDNIFLVDKSGRPDFVKVLDFGLAKISALDPAAKLTRSGSVFGTAEYMSPEQARGESTDHRTDVYALGCILYEMLTGDVPFRGESFMATLRRQIEDAPEPPSRRVAAGQINPPLEALVLKALAKDREARFHSMQELALALCAATGEDARALWGGEATAATTIASPTPSPSPSSPSPAAGSRLRVPRNRGPLVAAVALLALALAGGIAWKVRSRASVASPPPSLAPLPPPAPPPIAVPHPAPSSPSLPPQPATSRVSILSTPDGADVMLGVERLGHTPLELSRAADVAPFDVVIVKKGYAPQKLHVAPDKDREYVVALQPAPKSNKPRAPAPAPTPRQQPAPAAPKTPPELKNVE